MKIYICEHDTSTEWGGKAIGGETTLVYVCYDCLQIAIDRLKKMKRKTAQGLAEYMEERREVKRKEKLKIQKSL